MSASFTKPRRGRIDTHVHVDRWDTYDPQYFAHEGPLESFIDAALPVKQITVGVLHRGLAYQTANLEERARKLIKIKDDAGEIGMHAIVDCSPDIDGRAFKVMRKLKKEFAGKFEILVGAYPIFGFKHRGSDRHQHLEELAKDADFLVGLPERDQRPRDPEYTLGFNGHLSILIELALKYKIPLDIHTDQTNTPHEDGTEKLVEAVRWLMTSRFKGEKYPKVWAVHGISPNGYSEERFDRLIEGFQENNMGLRCCPHAALSMRQRRDIVGPTRNSIARVREFLLGRIEVTLGTDNNRDLFMPLPKSPLLEREIDALASAIRYYNETVLEKIACCERLTETDLDSIARSVAGDYEAFGWDPITSRKVYNGRH